MDRGSQLILHNGKDITADVKSCKFNSSVHKYEITFQGGKIYNYNFASIEWIKNSKPIHPKSVRITTQAGNELFGIQRISVFRSNFGCYWYVHFSNGSERTYHFNDIKVLCSSLDENSKSCMDYLRELASVNELKDDTGEALLIKQYNKIEFVDADTILASYLNPEEYKPRTFESGNLIFPFGGNASQFKAVANALSNQLSIIQGPPGTGKTQTILNIIANLLVAGKTVQVVSNNNPAILNVLEKLSSPSYNLGFLVASLGKFDNKKSFINSQTGKYPSLADWKLDTVRQSDLETKIQNNVQELSASFSAQERLAQARLDLDSLTLEMKYFDQYLNEAKLDLPKIKTRRGVNIEKIMQLWRECIELSERNRAISLWFKIKGAFLWGVADWSLYRKDILTITTFLQNLFYRSRHSELADEITELETQLATINVKNKMAELTELSMAYLRAKLFERCGDKKERHTFSADDLWKNANAVAKEYPIVLSTTFSSCSSLPSVTYDYLIMDEASQVDIATGALAFSCARNAVVVGDLKQLPNVITQELKERCEAIFNSYKLPQSYSFTANSFLKSVCGILPDAPQTLLREHYRCHPKIIGFCNQKFYNNELVIMTKDCGEKDALTVFKTVEGSHRRERVNQRQIDVTIREALPMLGDTNPQDVGIIAPYRAQVSEIVKQMGSCIEVDTVHKFQGREKDTILLTTVDDEVTDFSDDPYMLNVAVSRAKKRLCLVVSGNEQPRDSNIGDLISYIEYNSFKIVQSEIRSVFDLLYRQYTDTRIAFIKKHPSKLNITEAIMYDEIIEILMRYSSLSLDVFCHKPLNILIRDSHALNEEERKYAMHSATHVDFLIYNKISKKPVLAIEVDGFHYHKPGTRQHERDKMKNRILELYGIPFLRFPTNGSEECVKIEQFLAGYASGRL